MIYFLYILIALFLTGGIVAGVYFIIYYRKSKKLDIDNKIAALEKILYEKQFFVTRFCFVNKHLILALDRDVTKMAIIRDFSLSHEENDIEIITITLIKNIEKYANSIRFSYVKTGELKTLLISPLNNEIRSFIYDAYKKTCFLKIQEKYPYSKFDLVSGSDFELAYIWAYSKKEGLFAYSKTIDKYNVKAVNLLKENVTLDIKYEYFEAPVNGLIQQLFVFEKDFLPNLFNDILTNVKKKFAVVEKDSIYYDSYNNVLLLTNNVTSLQIVALNRVLEIYFEDGNKIKFEIKNSDKIVTFLANPELVENLIEFIINKNLRRIAKEFDYKSDKLINTTNSTKFIVDYTRKRIIYCANVDTISRFTYVMYPFNNIENVKLEGSGKKSFVRIFLKDNEILDVSCLKYEVAEYIAALIKKLINEMYGL